MSKKKSKQPENNTRQTKDDIRKRDQNTEDLGDSARDEERLKSDEAILDLPDVKDIPGQEFIHVPRIGEMADTTIASDDEEGVGIFSDEEETAGETTSSIPGEKFKEFGSNNNEERTNEYSRNKQGSDRKREEE